LKVAVGVVSGIGGYVVARYVPGGFVLLLMLGLPVLLGMVVGRKWRQERTRAVLAWSCLLAWVIPPVGMVVGAYVVAGQDANHPSTQQRVLAGICLLLSLANGVFGAFVAQHA
jgi:TRAP-type C4-dicarboxylate transport system permease large subunit